MVQSVMQRTMTIYYNYETTNMSFIDMFNYLKNTGRQNHSFHLVIYDPDLIGVDPRDPNLPVNFKAKIARECMVNYWYFIREVVRVPVQGGDVAGGIRYKLHRGNMALSYLFAMNYNVFLELPRQNGKTTAALIYYLWVYNFASSNSEIMFVNKKHDDSKRALQDLKKYRDALPSYLQMSEAFDREGKRIKVSNTATFIEHPTNGNKIRTAPGARTKQLANNLGRGCTMPLQYYDEFGWILYNKEIYMAAVPAFSTASKNARMNGSPYGILITTTPGDLTTNEGKFAEFMKNNATPWVEDFYDKTGDELEAIRQANTNSSFFYVKYTYQQLGRGEDYFKQMVVDLQRDWAVIRREVLLEWTTANMNCPFNQEDLDIIKSLCKPPINTVLLGNVGQFQMQVYEPINNNYPPIMGVDVSGGFQKDASAITIIDSKTTKVIATFNCNYISSPELARVIYEIVTKYMPNAIVNIERNGGFGASVLATLLETSIKKNIYWEWKERILEQRYPGDNKNLTTVKRTVKVYGLDNTRDTRNKLIELLFERVELHKDKFNAQILHDEMEQMETKNNGKIEHSSNSHDDQVFSYLMALYVWYYGTDTKRRYGLNKTALETDQETAIEYMPIEEQYGIELDIQDLSLDKEDDPSKVQEQIETISSVKAISFEDWRKSEEQKDLEALEMIRSNPVTNKAYMDKYNLNEDNEMTRDTYNYIPDSVFLNFNNFMDGEQSDPRIQGNLGKYINKVGDFR